MTGFFKKTLTKWSTIATLGVIAYLLGFSWGVKGLDRNEKIAAAREAQIQAAELQTAAATQIESEISLIVLPSSSKQTTNLSQLK